jgi:uncharacterized membrane protein
LTAGRPTRFWQGWARDVIIGAIIGAAVGAGFQDMAFGTWIGAAIGALLHLYFSLRVRP